MPASLDHLYWYRATLLEVTDGDTLYVLIDHGDNTFRKRFIRFNGINTPESTGAEKEERGLAAKKFLEDTLAGKTDLFLHTFRTSKNKSQDKSEKFGRLLADVWVADLKAWTVLEPSLNQQLIDAGHALAYDGKGKKPT